MNEMIQNIFVLFQPTNLNSVEILTWIPVFLPMCITLYRLFSENFAGKWEQNAFYGKR